MKFRYLSGIVLTFCFTILWVVNITPPLIENTFVEEEFSGPEEFVLFHHSIRTPADRSAPEYQPGFIIRELNPTE